MTRHAFECWLLSTGPLKSCTRAPCTRIIWIACCTYRFPGSTQKPVIQNAVGDLKICTFFLTPWVILWCSQIWDHLISLLKPCQIVIEMNYMIWAPNISSSPLLQAQSTYFLAISSLGIGNTTSNVPYLHETLSGGMLIQLWTGSNVARVLSICYTWGRRKGRMDGNRRRRLFVSTWEARSKIFRTQGPLNRQQENRS